MGSDAAGIPQDSGHLVPTTALHTVEVLPLGQQSELSVYICLADGW